MRHRKKALRIGRRPDHVRALLANQACSLILEEKIATTVVKAKAVRSLVEKMVTLGKYGSLHHRRRAISKLRRVDAVSKLFNEIAPRFAQRNGGYTRITRLGSRRGDAAAICYLEFVEESPTASKQGVVSVGSARVAVPEEVQTAVVQQPDATAETTTPADTDDVDSRSSIPDVGTDVGKEVRSDDEAAEGSGQIDSKKTD